MRILIFEDEKKSASRLVSLLRTINPKIEVLAVLDSIKSGIEWYNSNEHPDIVFQDIMLKDGDCFKIYQETEVNCSIIFTTAYNEFAVQSFELNSIAYVLKPYNQEEIEKALFKYSKLKEVYSANVSQLFAGLNFNNEDKVKARFLIKTHSKYYVLKSHDIAYFYSEDSVSFAIDFEGKKHILDTSITDLSRQLDNSTFFQLNRKLIINVNAIDRIESWFNARLKLFLKINTSHEFIVSRERVKEFKLWIEGQY